MQRHHSTAPAASNSRDSSEQRLLDPRRSDMRTYRLLALLVLVVVVALFTRNNAHALGRRALHSFSYFQTVNAGSMLCVLQPKSGAKLASGTVVVQYALAAYRHGTKYAHFSVAAGCDRPGAHCRYQLHFYRSRPGSALDRGGSARRQRRSCSRYPGAGPVHGGVRDRSFAIACGGSRSSEASTLPETMGRFRCWEWWDSASLWGAPSAFIAIAKIISTSGDRKIADPKL